MKKVEEITFRIGDEVVLYKKTSYYLFGLILIYQTITTRKPL